MTELHMVVERLSAVADEMTVLEQQRISILVEIGEKALPEFRDKPEFADLAAKANETTQRLTDLKTQEAALLAEKEQAEKEERERILKLICFACKTVNPEGAKFCEECGGKLGEPPREYCTACGTMNGIGVKFCGECGARLGEAAGQQ